MEERKQCMEKLAEKLEQLPEGTRERFVKEFMLTAQGAVKALEMQRGA